MPVPRDPSPRSFEVFGNPVVSAFVNILPSPNGPAHLVSSDGGTHEITRVYFENGHFQLGSGNDKLGPVSVVRATLDMDGDLFLIGHDGRHVWIPRERISAATYTPA